MKFFLKRKLRESFRLGLKKCFLFVLKLRNVGKGKSEIESCSIGVVAQ